MLLRRITEHVKNQNWTAVGLDFVIVVVGVFVGLQVQEWAEEQDRRELETTYTTRLHDEVVNLQATRSPLTAQRHRLLDSLKTATALLFGTVDRSLTTEECQGISFSYVVSNPTDDLASLIELQSSAGLSQFRNENVLAALRAFLLQRARFRDSRAGIAETVIELPSAYPELIRVVSPSSVSESPTPGTFECDVEEMRRSSGFMNDYELNQANFAFHVRDIRRVDKSLADLHRILDEVLQLDHTNQDR
jgi:hypothetical protein